MVKVVTLPNGQEVIVLGPAEATRILNCELEQLGEWISTGAIHSVCCPNCQTVMPDKEDVEDLLDFAKQFPIEIALDEIVGERVRSIKRRGPLPQKTERQVHLDPRSRSGKKPLPSLRTTDAYEEDGHRRQTFQRLQPGRR